MVSDPEKIPLRTARARATLPRYQEISGCSSQPFRRVRRLLLLRMLSAKSLPVIRGGFSLRPFNDRTRSRSLDAKTSGVAVKHKPAACHESNLQHRPPGFKSPFRPTNNESVPSKKRRPYGREIFPLPHHFCANLRELFSHAKFIAVIWTVGKSWIKYQIRLIHKRATGLRKRLSKCYATRCKQGRRNHLPDRMRGPKSQGLSVN